MDLVEHEKLLATLRDDPAKPVIDGPVCAARYERANPRILWILREHHGGNGWDYREFLATDQALFGYRRWKKTLGPIAIISCGLLRGCVPYGEWAKDPSKLTDYLREIAVVNINKEGGGTQVQWDRFLESAAKYASIVAKQIEYLDPHVVICAGTAGIAGLPASSTISGGRVYVRAYHPNQRTLTQRAYYDFVCQEVRNRMSMLGSSQ